MKRFFPMFLAAFFLCACAAERPGLIVESSPLNLSEKTILIQRFEFNPEIATGVPKGAAANFGELIALDLQRLLKEAGFRNTVVIAPAESARGDILIKGMILRVQGGDALQRRTLELFGFGATEVKAMGEVTDLGSSNTILSFSLTKGSHYTWLDNEPAVRENFREIAGEIAAALARMR